MPNQPNYFYTFVGSSGISKISYNENNKSSVRSTDLTSGNAVSRGQIITIDPTGRFICWGREGALQTWRAKFGALSSASYADGASGTPLAWMRANAARFSGFVGRILRYASPNVNHPISPTSRVCTRFPTFTLASVSQSAI